MADFKKALETGLAANKDANAKRREIGGVVEELSTTLRAATSDVVQVVLRQAVREKVRVLRGIVANLTGENREVTEVRYTALVAERIVEPKQSAELAEVELEPTGYPVYVRSSGVNGHAYDRESLERVLSEVLEHPDTGGRIQRLLDLQPKK